MKKIIIPLILLALSLNTMAQDKKITRIARITVDSAQLDAYFALLKEQMNAAIRLEPGVLSYTMYADKSDATKLTLIEEYASNEAYLLHREAPHFKKYKAASKDMVKSLELSEVTMVLSAKKEN